MDTIILTTNHSASSYGAPVMVIDGQAYGPGDLTPGGVIAAELLRQWAARFLGPFWSVFVQDAQAQG